MANPLYQNQPNQREMILAQAMELKNSLKVNPREEVNRLLASGQMSQDDFNRFVQVARAILGN
ncbi:MAG: hypothetical protein IJ366_00330 [Clostridia bacterium]|nr:hypothetical protein [Clostridia bacterium]